MKKAHKAPRNLYTRTYTAHADTGRDYISFHFESRHRANSKANKDDARRAYKAAHGHAVEIINTTRGEL